MMLRILTASLVSLLSTQALAYQVVNHKSPTCGCCSEWSQHLQQNGFTVTDVPHQDMAKIKQQLGIAPKLASCHTAEINGYLFEGHIPAKDIQDFLANPPEDAKGLAVPGMPLGSPGMEYGDHKDSYRVYVFNAQGEVATFREH
ncbi:DUF411 domain-containing protein [Vibrio cincinnatiensis]|uniref:DUF411 domain-containing protein n=1 Tax=Vibrio cincinnatiensis TaxID=675 RepID=UPI001EDE5BDE|nr:DUF411 domain-containing protein [Vibrio cincinnatiensis]MCG3730534.1 DUF411 domain-containing protein [Vibrio cincinnatiensis]